MKLWTKNMRTSNISGPTSNNKVLKRMAMGRKAAETHTNTRLDRAQKNASRLLQQFFLALQYLSIAGIDEVCHTSHKECEHHV